MKEEILQEKDQNSFQYVLPETLDYIHDKISINIEGLPDFVEFDPYTRSLNFDLQQIGTEA